MSDLINYTLFNPSDSLYKEAFKLHRFKDALFLSLRAINDSIGYTEILFPGDDRDQIVVKEKKDLYFRINERTLEERLKSITDTTRSIIFAHKQGEEEHADILIDFYFHDEIDPSLKMNLQRFPNKIETNFNYLDPGIDLSDCW